MGKSERFSASALSEEALFVYTTEKVYEKFDFINNEVHVLGKIKNYNAGTQADGKMFLHDDKLYIFYVGGTYYSVLDLKKNELKIIDFEQPIGLENYMFSDIYQNMIYILSYTSEITIINTLTEKEKHITVDAIKQGRTEEKINFLGAACRIGEIIWALAIDSMDMVSLNVNDYSVKLYRMQFSIAHPIHMLPCGEKILILSDEGDVYSFDTISKEMELVVEMVEELREENAFGRMIDTREKLWLLPNFGDYICYLEKNTGRIKLYQEYPTDYAYVCSKEELEIRSKFWDYSENGKYICFSNNSANYILMMDKTEGKIKWIRSEVPEGQKLRFHYLNQNLVFLENNSHGVKNLINMLFDEKAEVRWANV